MKTPKHEIEITIKPDGSLESTVEGIDGASCSEISKWLDELGTVEKDLKTKDYYKAGGGQNVHVGS